MPVTEDSTYIPKMSQPLSAYMFHKATGSLEQNWIVEYHQAQSLANLSFVFAVVAYVCRPANGGRLDEMLAWLS